MASQPIALRLPGAAPMRRLFAGPPPQSRAGQTPVQALDTAVDSWTSKALWNKKAAPAP